MALRDGFPFSWFTSVRRSADDLVASDRRLTATMWVIVALGMSSLFFVVGAQYLPVDSFKVLARDSDLPPDERVRGYVLDQKASVQETLQVHRAAYKENVSAFLRNIYVTGLFVMIACMLLVTHKQSVSVPLMPEVQIPAMFLALGAASALGYLWIYFGFILHQVIDQRMAIVRLATLVYDVQNNVAATPQLTGTDLAREYYLFTSVNDLKDTGFLDAWFYEFLGKYYPTGQISPFDRVIPVVILCTIGVLQGIAHCCWLGLLVHWPHKYQAPRWATISVRLFFLFSFFLIIGSHRMFLYSGRNANWVQVVIAVVFALGFICVCLSRPPRAEASERAKSRRQIQPKPIADAIRNRELEDAGSAPR